MRIAHLTSAHPAYDTRIFHHEAVALAGAGHDVAVVAPHTADAVTKGVRVIAVPRGRDRGERLLLTVPRVYQAARRERADIYHLHDPDLLVPVGALLKASGHRVVYDAHEDYSLQTLSKDWIHPRLRQSAALAIRMAEGVAAHYFDAIVAATPPIARRFPQSKTWVIQNFADLEEFPDSDAAPYSPRPNVIVYVGGISKNKGADTMIHGIEKVPSQLGARLALAGPFDSAGARDELTRLSGWEHVDYHGVLDRDSISRLLSRARIGVVVLPPFRNYLESYPTKLFEYMLAGMPVVASDFPLWRRLVVDAGCGLAVSPSSPDELAAAITWLLEHPDEAAKMGERGRSAVHERYSWQAEARKLLRMYEQWVG